MNTPPKKPVQPWIPQKVTRIPRQDSLAQVPGAQVVHVVHHHAGLASQTRAQVNGPLRAGWIFALVTGGLLGVGAGMAFGKGAAGGFEVMGMIFFGLGYYLAIFFDLVVSVLAIIAMARGAVGRGLFLLLGAPLMMLIMAGAGGLIGYGLRHGILIEEKTVHSAGGKAAENPVEEPVEVDPLKSAVRVDEILAGARKMLAVRDEATYQAAKNDAYATAAHDPALTETHRETVRTALHSIYEESDSKRGKQPKFPR